MGYHLFSYAINTDTIQAVLGSKDNDTLEAIKDSHIYSNYTDDSDYGRLIDMALEDIFNGLEYNKVEGFAYGYALITICAHLGEELPYTQEIKLGYETDFINQYLAADFQVNALLIEEALLPQDTLPIPIPPIQDWPMIGLLPYSALIALSEKLVHIHIDDETIETIMESDDEKGFAYEHIMGIIKNIDYCIANKMDLITFCH